MTTQTPASTSDARKRQAEKEASLLQVGDHVWFDGKATRWLVRGVTEFDAPVHGHRRYAIATSSMFGRIYYTIVDEIAGIRGAMNVIGGGLGIYTTEGPDEAIDEALRMLRPPLSPDAMTTDGEPRGFEISHRNRVPLRITRHVSAKGDPA